MILFTFSEHLLATAKFMPHGICYLWKPGLVGLHLVSNAIIALSYFSIPLSLIGIINKRKDLPFNWIFFLFAAFILSCGIGHSMDIWTLWHPDYWFSGYIRAITALVSLITAIALVYLMPQILTLPSPAQMEETNNCLAQEINERQQIEEALRKSEQRWQLALQGTGDGLFDWNIVTGEAFMSATLKANLGYKDEEIANNYEGWHQLVHRDDLERVEQEIQAHLEAKTSQYFCEYRMGCKDDSYKWILARGKVQRNKDGQPIRMVGSHQDISIRKQAEAEIEKLNQELEERVIERTAELEKANHLKDDLLIREQQARKAIEIYEDLVNNIPIGLSIWHLEKINSTSGFKLIEINPVAAQLLQLNPNQDRGTSMGNCLPSLLGPSQQMVVEAYAKVVDSGQVKNFSDVRYNEGYLSGQTFAVTAFPLPEQCLGIAFENITERKRIEKALIESSRRYRLVVNSVKEVIFQTDTEGNWIFLNPAWTEITGFTIIDSLKHPFSDYISLLEDQHCCQEAFKSIIAGEQESLHCIFRLKTKTGDLRWIEMNAQPNLDDEDKISGSSGTLRDITERQEAKAVLQARAKELTQLNRNLLETTARLEKRNQELDQFAYVTSHDLKAPLRAIANLSEWLEEDLEDKLDEDTREQMNLLRGRVHRMENLINGLLHYSRVGRLNAKPETVYVNQLLNEVLEYLSPPPEFTIEWEEKMPILETKRLPLQQVFLNLIGNALKHHHREEGKISISVQDQGEYYQFTISDDGPGIAPEYHEKVFVIFQTLEPRDKNENTGIGLSIVKKTVEAEGGTIELESQLGQGTTFRFTWPKLVKD